MGARNIAELHFREATPEDFVLLARIIRSAFRPVAVRLGFDREKLPNYAAFESAAHLREHVRDRQITMFLLEVDGQAVACGGCSPDREVADKGWVNRVAVRPKWQSKGLGRAMVAFLHDELRRRGYKRVRLGCLPHLEPFYASFGYQVVEKRQLEHWPEDLLFMEMDL